MAEQRRYRCPLRLLKQGKTIGWLDTSLMTAWYQASPAPPAPLFPGISARYIFMFHPLDGPFQEPDADRDHAQHHEYVEDQER